MSDKSNGLTLPKGVKPTKILAKRKPTNEVNAEYTSGCLHANSAKKRYELHVTDGGNRAAAIVLESETFPDKRFTTGQIPAPAIRELERKGALQKAKDAVEVWVPADEAELSLNRDSRLFDAPMDVTHLIPEGGKVAVSIALDVKRLAELAKALGSDKVTLTMADPDAEVLLVEPFEGPHYGSIRQSPRPTPAPENEPQEGANLQALDGGGEG